MPPPRSDPGSRKVGDFYAAGWTRPAIEARGTAPLRPYLDRIAAVRSRADLIACSPRPAITAPVGIGIIPDPADPTRYIAVAGQGGLGLPNRDYYLREGEKYDALRAAYRAYMVELQRLAGIADAEAKADRIIALERRIAKAHWTPERSRDIQADLQSDEPRAARRAGAAVRLGRLSAAAAASATSPTVIAAETTAITGDGKMLDAVPLETWKDYLAFHFISSHAQFLPRAFDEANFNFFSSTLRGVAAAARPLEARRRHAQRRRSARRSARSMSSAISRPRAAARWPS